MAATPQFADLTTVPTQAQVLNQEVLPQLVANGANVNSWPIGGVYRAMSMVVAFCRANARLALAALTAAGFEDYVFGRVAAPGGIDVTGWAPIVAKQRYGLTQKAATYTQRTITLTNTSGTTYSNLQPGSIILVFPSGNRYFLNQVVTIPAQVGSTPGSATATFRSEFQMAAGLSYNNDPSGASISFATSSFPGVTATNPGPTFSTPVQSGTGVGSLTLSGSPSGGAHNVAVKITSTGVAGTAGWSTSLDGAAFVTQSGSSVTNLGGFGINIALNDNGGNPSFVVGTSYYFSTPGTDITQVGATIETPQALGVRVAGMWPLLAFTTDANGNFVPPASPTQNAYLALALSSNANVVIAFATQDPAVNNLVRLYVCGQGGAILPASVLASVQTFFNSFSMLTDQVTVLSPTARAITLAFSSGSITVKNSQLASAQDSLQDSMQAYLGGVDPSQPLGVNGLVDYDYIISLIRRTPGVVRVPVGTLTINGSAADLQLPVTAGAYEVATWTQQVLNAFSWVTI